MTRKKFSELTPPEIIALAISQEEEDSNIYGQFAERIRSDYPATANILVRMQEEESDHRLRLISAFRHSYGEHIPLIRRYDVRGFPARKPLWLAQTLGISQIRAEVEDMERASANFYQQALAKTSHAPIRELLGTLAVEESKHSDLAGTLTKEMERSGQNEEENHAERRRFVLQYVQPGLAGLMDGSVSTLAPVFAAAFATHSSKDALLVGLAASIGAGISMGFAEALSDDGVVSGRGNPWLRGLICGLMTTAGGIGHTLPYLIPNFYTATIVAVVIVCLELAIISWIRHKYMDTPLLGALFQVVLGGVLVFIVGILIGLA